MFKNKRKAEEYEEDSEPEPDCDFSEEEIDSEEDIENNEVSEENVRKIENKNVNKIDSDVEDSEENVKKIEEKNEKVNKIDSDTDTPTKSDDIIKKYKNLSKLKKSKKENVEKELDSVEKTETYQNMIDKIEHEGFFTIGLSKVLSRACNRVGWFKPTPIQAKCIPLALEGKDIIGLAETGSGKTGAFALPIIQRLLMTPQRPFAIIITPTRELAQQIKTQFEALGSVCQLYCAMLIGGMCSKNQAKILEEKPHIIIGTPGRIVSHLRNTKGFSLKNIKFFVMDEADRILDHDFDESITAIVEQLPLERQVMLFSATMTNKVDKLRKVMLKKPEVVEVSCKYQVVDKLKQFMIFVPHMHKPVYLAYILNDIGKEKLMMIFCMTAKEVILTALGLRVLGFHALPLFGTMPQDKRLGVLNKFRSRQRNILVTTDVSARGLDVPCVDYVINYDTPLKAKDYVHRVGRTARAGREGTAITIVDQYTALKFVKIETFLGTKLDVYPAEEKDVMNLRASVLEAWATAEKQKETIKETGEIMTKKELRSEIDPTGGFTKSSFNFFQPEFK